MHPHCRALVEAIYCKCYSKEQLARRIAYRTVIAGGFTSNAKVTNGTLTFDIPEETYRQGRFEPEFELLPWKHKYENASKMDDS
jgi:hypothetical protein